jgi:hypothetical protein
MEHTHDNDLLQLYILMFELNYVLHDNCVDLM